MKRIIKEKKDIWIILFKSMLLMGMLLFCVGIVISFFEGVQIYNKMCAILGEILIYCAVTGAIIVAQRRKTLTMNAQQLIGVVVLLIIFLLNSLLMLDNNLLIKRISMLFLSIMFCIQIFIFYRYWNRSRH